MVAERVDGDGDPRRKAAALVGSQYAIEGAHEDVVGQSLGALFEQISQHLGPNREFVIEESAVGCANRVILGAEKLASSFSNETHMSFGENRLTSRCDAPKLADRPLKLNLHGHVIMLLGAHQSIKGGLFRAIERGREATCDVVQVFNKSSNQWRAKALTDEDIRLFRTAQYENGILAVCSHASYLINIASPKPGLRTKSVDALAVEMRRCNQLGIPNLVLHPGSHVGNGEEQGLRQVVVSLEEMFSNLDNNEVTLCLENTAGQGSNLGYTFGHLASIIEACPTGKIGVCLDTCHLFAAGYPLTTQGDLDSAVHDLDILGGLEAVRMIHLNDSKNECGSRKDRHEHIGEGEIGLEGFRILLNDERFAGIPMVLETPKEGDGIDEDKKNLATLRGLIIPP